MKIAIMGIRGIPANYGGFETFIEEMAPRLVQRGHEVTVFGRSNIIDYQGSNYKGVRIKVLPTIRHKYFDTVAHTCLCTLYSFFTPYDVVFICNSANALFCFIPRLLGKPTVLNVDGLEWKRQKWNQAGKAFYKISEFLATFLPSAIVSDARDVQRYYCQKFQSPSYYIPYGAPIQSVSTHEVLHKFALRPREYVLYVSRMEPENNAHLVVEAFERVQTEKKLVMVGDAPYSDEYISRLKATRDPRIVFTGYVFGQGYRELQSHAYLYIQATEVGGTHPALLEGMGYGNCIIANNVPEHHEVLGDAGFYFNGDDPDDLRNQLQNLLHQPEIVGKYRRLAQDRAKSHYSWEIVTRDYERLFHQVARKG
ncbi:MAG TPA: glycosyltransferase [bacterium]|nr:glycosyltransferase [bacterium]HNT65132.1 glycosyltransferase [bacterium]HOX86340.1 glycosyltransferase [bacterium]HPG45831.1 glycosyltransferase [bacterium]HPM97942.1 glycosyltransferase [bacterium]